MRMFEGRENPNLVRERRHSRRVQGRTRARGVLALNPEPTLMSPHSSVSLIALSTVVPQTCLPSHFRARHLVEWTENWHWNAAHAGRENLIPIIVGRQHPIRGAVPPARRRCGVVWCGFCTLTVLGSPKTRPISCPHIDVKLPLSFTHRSST